MTTWKASGNFLQDSRNDKFSAQFDLLCESFRLSESSAPIFFSNAEMEELRLSSGAKEQSENDKIKWPMDPRAERIIAFLKGQQSLPLAGGHFKSPYYSKTVTEPCINEVVANCFLSAAIRGDEELVSFLLTKKPAKREVAFKTVACNIAEASSVAERNKWQSMAERLVNEGDVSDFSMKSFRPLFSSSPFMSARKIFEIAQTKIPSFSFSEMLKEVCSLALERIESAKGKKTRPKMEREIKRIVGWINVFPVPFDKSFKTIVSEALLFSEYDDDALYISSRYRLLSEFSKKQGKAAALLDKIELSLAVPSLTMRESRARGRL